MPRRHIVAAECKRAPKHSDPERSEGHAQKGIKSMTKKEIFYQKALSLIHQKGFKAMTMRDLAAAMSCDIKNLYHYTKSKNGILEDLLFNISAAFHRGIDQILDASINPIQQIEELIRLNVDLSFGQPLEVGLLVDEWRNLEEPHLSRFIGERNDYESKVKSILLSGIQEDYFRSFHIEITTQSILGSLRWQHNYYARLEKKLNPLDTKEELKRLILPGLVKG